MKKNLIINFIFLAIFSFVSLNTYAQNQKIAFVDADAIYPNMPEAKAAKSELEQYKSILEKQLDN